MMVEANNLFETLLLVQVQQNSKRRLFARLCANSDGWERFMSSGLITTWNFPLEEYQFIATSLEEQTAFLQVNCRLLEEHFDTAFALLAPPWIDDPSATNRVAEDVLVDTERITTLLDTQYFVLLTVRDTIRRMTEVFAEH